MTGTAIKNAKSCAVQLLVTEVASVAFFGRHFFGRGIWIGFMAPIAVFFLPVFALEDREYSEFLVCLLVDLGFLSLMAFLVVKNQRLLARTALFLVNIASVMLVLGSY